MTAPVTDPRVRGASAIIKAQLEAWGIGTLYNDAVRILKQGLNADAVLAQLQDTAAFKQRFWYNDARRKAGLPVLSPAEAVATENQMRQILQAAGFPAGFFDSPQDVGNFIARNMSAVELAERVEEGRDRWFNAPGEDRAVVKEYYGLTDGEAIAMILNPDVAKPLVQRRLRAGALGGAAQRQGLSVGAERAEQLVQLGVTPEKAQAGYGQVAAALPTDSSIAERFGSTFTQGEEESAVFLQDAEALKKKQALNAAEESLFAGRGATNTAGLSGGSGSR